MRSDLNKGNDALYKIVAELKSRIDKLEEDELTSSLREGGMSDNIKLIGDRLDGMGKVILGMGTNLEERVYPGLLLSDTANKSPRVEGEDLLSRIIFISGRMDSIEHTQAKIEELQSGRFRQENEWQAQINCLTDRVCKLDKCLEEAREQFAECICTCKNAIQKSTVLQKGNGKYQPRKDGLVEEATRQPTEETGGRMKFPPPGIIIKTANHGQILVGVGNDSSDLASGEGSPPGKPAGRGTGIRRKREEARNERKRAGKSGKTPPCSDNSETDESGRGRDGNGSTSLAPKGRTGQSGRRYAAERSRNPGGYPKVATECPPLQWEAQ